MSGPTADDFIRALVEEGARWATPGITFSIPTTGSAWPGYSGSAQTYAPFYGAEPMSAQYAVLSGAQAGAFRDAMNAWARLIAVSIVETDDPTNPGQIRVAFTDTGMSGGYATYPPNAGSPPDPIYGDIWLSSRAQSRTLRVGWDLAGGDSPQPTLLHEIGHALGLSHPFEGPDALPSAYDRVYYSVMAYGLDYFGEETLTFWPTTDGEFRYQGSRIVIDAPTVNDILAIQSIYGANPNTAAGNDSYTFEPGKPFIRSIYDAAGVDTIDLSNHTRRSILDLTPGAYSSIDLYTAEEQKAHWTWLNPKFSARIIEALDRSSEMGLLYTGRDNLGLAYSTTIEVALGGAGADTITGNDAANTLSGGGGDDAISGAAGDDTISGGSGANFLLGGDGADTILGGTGFDRINGNVGNDSILGGGGNDWVLGGQGRDVLLAGDGDDIVNGNLGDDTANAGAGADTVRGGQGADSLNGWVGNDVLFGDLGDDTLSGGAGADGFRVFAGGGADIVLDFDAAEGDQIQVEQASVYTTAQVGADAVIQFIAGGQVVLAGVNSSLLPGGWIAMV